MYGSVRPNPDVRNQDGGRVGGVGETSEAWTGLWACKCAAPDLGAGYLGDSVSKMY